MGEDANPLYLMTFMQYYVVPFGAAYLANYKNEKISKPEAKGKFVPPVVILFIACYIFTMLNIISLFAYCRNISPQLMHICDTRN